MQYLSDNLNYLRGLKNWTPKQVAERCQISVSSYRKYEKGQSLPRLQNLAKLSHTFKRSIDELLYLQLKEADQQTPDNLKGEKIRILPIVVDESEENEHVSLVPIKAAAGYTAGYADAEFIADLPRFSLPFAELSQHRTYRVFQIEGDSMLPIKNGSYIICEYVQNWEHLDTKQPHIVVTKDDGVVFKRIHINKQNMLELASDNKEFETYTLPLSQVMEIWLARAYVSFEFDQA
ncbi:MAG: LexA family transcriptional regulator [Carboxylicivirga sp.]|jgi:transcriptional regulator with XRE-family HTH domain|nr:LexA family transcriptional regulator [Carboxylicivirga sp.]